MNIDCPYCDKNMELDGEDLPERACDDEDFMCRHCENVFQIGWYATAEVRSMDVELGDTQ